MKSLFKFFSALFIAVFMGSVVSHATGMDMEASVGGAVTISTAMSFVPEIAGSANAVVLKQMWETELINKFRHDSQWLSRIMSRDNYVNNNAINLSEIGADPDVLINNTTYPISVVSRTDEGHVIALNKYDTVNSKITDDELYALPYDKEGSILRQHRETLEERTAEHGLHIIAPAAHSATTPILSTSGADDGNGRMRLTSSDIIRLKKAYDDHKIPKSGRILVLCSEHVADLLEEDKVLRERYMNATTGMIAAKYYGFDLYEDNYAVQYDDEGAKKAFQAEPAVGDVSASIAFYAPRVVKAKSGVKMYHAKAEDNPTMRESVVGFRLYNIVIPKTTLGTAAIISAPVPDEVE